MYGRTFVIFLLKWIRSQTCSEPLILAALQWIQAWRPNVKDRTGTQTQGHPLTGASTLPIELPSNIVDLRHFPPALSNSSPNRANTLPSELPSDMVDFDIFPCFIRLVAVPARNHSGTIKACTFNAIGSSPSYRIEEHIMVRPELQPRASR